MLTGEFTALQAYLKKQEKNSNKPSNFTLKGTGEKQQTKPKVSRRKEIIKIRAEINEMESKKNTKINESNSWFFEKIRLTNL